MNDFFQQYKKDLDKVIEFYTSEITKIRTGRATPALVENIPVQAYDSQTPLIQLASITAPEARTLVISPWDKTIVKNIEKAINSSSLGVHAVNEGNIIRITLPQMTEETRKELIKLLGQKTEKARRSLRSLRDQIKEKIIQQEKEKLISEDERFQLQKELDEIIRDYNDKIKELYSKKENAILKI